MSIRLSKAEARKLGIKIPGSKAGKKKGGSRHRIDDLSHLEQPHVKLVFPLKPKVKDRPRLAIDEKSVRRAFSISKGNYDVFRSNIQTRAVTTAETRNFEKEVARTASVLMLGKKPLWGPVELLAKFILPGDPAYWPTSHVDGDLDNYEKSFFDSLNQLVYTDDSIIVRKMTEKEFGGAGNAEILLYAVPATIPTSLIRYMGTC